MSGVSLAVPQPPSQSQKQGGGGNTGGVGLMGSLRVIELQLVAFILVISASGLVPIFDLVFPAVASVYLLALSKLVFPSHGTNNTTRGESTADAGLFHGSRMFRLYVIAGTIVGMFLPLAYVLGGFARGDDHAVRSTTPHLFLLSFQILTENVLTGLSLFSDPVRVLVPLLYTGRRIFVILDWTRDVWINKTLPADATFQVTAWYWFGRGLSVGNLAYYSVNLFCFLIPRFLPRAFDRYFKERDETRSKMAEDKRSDGAGTRSSYKKTS